MRHVLIALVLGASACTGGEITLEPPRLDWGEVDFQEERPATGFLPQDVELRNTGTRNLDIRLEGLDEVHLLVGALLASEKPPTMPTLGPDETHVVTVAVWGYDLEAGERDSEVSGTLRFDADGMSEPARLEWTFTPVRNIGGDTGL